MMKRQIGDRVRIRTWEEMEEQFGLDEDGFIPTGNEECPTFFAPGMKDFCGLEATVTDFYETGGKQQLYVLFDDYPRNAALWFFTEDMVERLL